MELKYRLQLFVCLVGVVYSENCSSTLHIPLPSSKTEVVHQECNGCTNESNHCPPWYRPAKGGTCQFGSSIGGTVSNNPSTMQTALLYFNCMTSTNLTGTKRDMVGGCSITVPSKYEETYFKLPCNISELNHFMCAGANRDGQLCGKCREGFALPVYSYSLICLNCTNYSLNWLKYLGIAFGPLTVFSVFVSLFHICPTSPYLHGFIFTAHILCSPPVVRTVVNSYEQVPPAASIVMATKVYYAFFGIWSLDFFRLVYEPFCIHPKLTIIQTLALDYIVAVYPLLLVIATYLLVSLHDRNCKPLIYMWKPCKNVIRAFLHKINVQTSLIDSFATLFFLSTIKFQSVSLDLLFPISVYHMDGTHDSKFHLYMAGDVEYFGPEHMPFAILAIAVLLLFVIFPTLLLFLYPCRCFQQCLNALHCNSQRLRFFMDVFLGTYKDGTNNSRDLRYFAGVFFLLRLLFISLLTYLNFHYATTSIALMLSTFLFVLAIFRPQKSCSHFTTDYTFIFSLQLLLICIVAANYPNITNPLSSISQLMSTAALAPHVFYFVGLVTFWLFVKKKLAQRVFHNVQKYSRLLVHNEERNLFGYAS